MFYKRCCYYAALVTRLRHVLIITTSVDLMKTISVAIINRIKEGGCI